MNENNNKLLKGILTAVLIAVCIAVPKLRVLIVIIAAIAGKSVLGISAESLRRRLGCGFLITAVFIILYVIFKEAG